MNAITAFLLCTLPAMNLPSKEPSEGSYYIADQTMFENNPSIAIIEYTNAIEFTPDNLSLFLLRGLAFEKLNQLENASNDFDSVINHPNVKKFELITALAGKIRIYTLQGDFESCERIYSWLEQLEKEFFFEIDNQISSLDSNDFPIEICEICNSPIEIIETEKGVTLRCNCEN